MNRAPERVNAGSLFGPDIVDADPTIDIRNITRISGVIQWGRLITKPSLDSIIAKHRRPRAH